jgi:hypothetical protein
MKFLLGCLLASAEAVATTGKKFPGEAKSFLKRFMLL